MINFKEVTKLAQRGQVILDQVSFTVREGEFIYLVGASGSGKTSIFKLMTREWELDSGSIKIGTYPIEKIKEQQLYILRRKIGLIPQEDFFLPSQTVYANLAYVLSVLDVKKREWSQRIDSVLAQVGMQAYSHALPEELSVGQSKRIAIARALITNPSIIVADEPTANLDAKSAVEIMKLFYRFHQRGTTVLVSTHDSTMVNTFRNRVLELSHGRLIRDEQLGSYTRFADPKDVYVF